jgi:hypothetical protein
MANMAALNQIIEGTDTDPMADESVELTEGQKACLRLVDHHLTSKEIGRFLRISHFTVDQRLDAARRKLNAATRKDAAKIFAAIEQRTISEPFVYETQDLERGQYGASQSAVIAAIPVLRFSGNPGLSRQSMAGRLSVAHGSVRERELAAGVRWRPVARIPVQVIAERRFCDNRPDAFAALVAGGQSGVKLPLGFQLDGYGQAGFVSGQGGGPFADVAVQAHRSIAQSQRASFAIGAGIWGGGQDNVMRIDIGPNMRANVRAGSALFQLDASWRVRVAGHAQPGNGPAMTLSTSF